MSLQLAVETSTFAIGAAQATFGWEYGGPQIEKRDALDHYTGTIWTVIHGSFTLLYSMQRPVAVAPVTPLGPVYVDWWGTDPSGTLIIGLIETRRAILVEMKGVKWVDITGRYIPGVGAVPGVHQATVDFLLLS